MYSVQYESVRRYSVHTRHGGIINGCWPSCELSLEPGAWRAARARVIVNKVHGWKDLREERELLFEDEIMRSKKGPRTEK